LSVAHGPEPDGRDVTAIARRAHAWRVASCATESLLLGGAAALLVETAALLSGRGAQSAWPAALVLSALAGLTWWLEQRTDVADTVRALDRRLACAGALATAFELEGRGRVLEPLEALVQARALAHLARPAGRLFRPQPLASAVLLGAALAWIIARDVGRDQGAEDSAVADLARLSAGLAGALDPALGELAAGEPGSPASSEAERAGAALANGDAQLERSLARGDRAEARRALEVLDGELLALERRARQEGRSSERLREARTWLDALRTALAPERAGAGAAADALTAGVPDGTMSGSSGTPDAPPMASAAPPLLPLDTSPPARSGVPDVRAWPPAYREVVTRWIELRRAALEGEG